ncbi:hypothetical protein BDF14DRAFT_1764175 [Spinellus fusiger]|nr:hypothetical protein BDF14DRAFT_1764175 [Spinellus fusiger]
MSPVKNITKAKPDMADKGPVKNITRATSDSSDKHKPTTSKPTARPKKTPQTITIEGDSEEKVTKAGPKKIAHAPVAAKKRLTPAEALLQSMTAKKAAKDALLKNSAPTVHTTFDEEGNSVVIPAPQKEVSVEKKRKPVSKEEAAAKKRKIDESLEEMQASVEAQKKTKVKKPRAERKLKADTPKTEKKDETEKLGKKEEALAYLHLFSTDRASWKFRKVQQIWLLQHLYDTEEIEDKDFDLVVNYIKDMQGMARKNLLVEAQKICQASTGIAHTLTGYLDTHQDTSADANNGEEDDFDAEKLLARATTQVAVSGQEIEAQDPKAKRAKTIVQVLL